MQENMELEKQLLNDDDLFKDSDEYVVKNINSKIKPNIKNTTIDDDDIDDVLNDLGVGAAQNKPKEPKVNPKDNYLKNKKKALFLNSDDTTPRDEYKKTEVSNKPKSLLNKHKLDGNSRDIMNDSSENNNNNNYVNKNVADLKKNMKNTSGNYSFNKQDEEFSDEDNLPPKNTKNNSNNNKKT
jgi:hypothetical protein